ncbi:MAG: DUF1674 domain-containing protein [Oceanicaulis sp.]
MSDGPETPESGSPRPLSEAAKRALAEAEERRRKAEAEKAARETEHGGPKGPEPTRYGDWEKKGITYDF